MNKFFIFFVFIAMLGFNAMAQDVISLNDLKSEFDRIGTDDKEMLTFFKKNNFTEYYNAFESACGQRNTGAKLLESGIGLMVGGAVFVFFGAIGEDLYWMMPVGYVLMGVGEVLTIVSFPVSASAGARKRVIKNNFAREYFGIDCYTYQPKLKFGQTTNGIGLILNF
jgi:hypothetical protein